MSVKMSWDRSARLKAVVTGLSSTLCHWEDRQKGDRDKWDKWGKGGSLRGVVTGSSSTL